MRFTNTEGLTWLEWLYATCQDVTPASEKYLQYYKMWREGVDPTEVRAG